MTSPLLLLARFAAVLALATGLAACASTERIVLLPNEDGTHGEIEVRTGGGVQVLERPLEGATVGPLGGIAVVEYQQREVERDFAEVMAAMPPAPQRYLLYFHEGTTELMDESRAVMQSLLKSIDDTPVADIQITGHTDRVGRGEDNDELALSRAEAVRLILQRQGLDHRTIRAVGRGEREPLVPTEDGIEEPRNRRVEVVIR